MATYERTIEIEASAETVFDFVSDVENLPRYFDRMKSAEPADGEAVHVTAQVAGHSVEGEAWFRTHADRRRVEWGSEGPSDYAGELDVDGGGPTSRLTVRLHASHGEDEEIETGLEQTLVNVKRQVESGRASAG